MSENHNINNSAGSAAEADAKRRAERIAAIRKAMHSDEEAVRAAVRAEKAPAEIPAAPAESWEDELSARIAKRMQSVKQKKNSEAEDILAALDRENARKAEAPVEKAVKEIAEPVRSAAAPIAEELPAEDTAADVIRSAVRSEAVFAAPEAAGYAAPERLAVPEEEAPVNTGKKKKKKKKKKKTFKESFLGLFPRKGDSIGERIRKLVFLGSIAAIIVCGYLVADYYYELWYSKKYNDKVMGDYWDSFGSDRPHSNNSGYSGSLDGDAEQPVYTLLDGAKALLDINDEVAGVIMIPDTLVNNPVMKAEDNDKYLDRKMNNKQNRAGELFFDYRVHFDDVDYNGHLEYPNSDNLVIYGHNMGDDQMFGCLKYYERNYDYYENHPIIYLNSNYNEYTYKIFSFFILDAEDETETKFDCWNKINFDDEGAFYDFVNEAKRRTIRTNDVDVKYGDKLLTLSTCNTMLGDRGRLIIMARLVREGEDPYEGTQNSQENPNIKWPSMYYDIRTNEHYDPDAEFVPYGPSGSDESESESK